MAIFGDTKPTSPVPSTYADLPPDIDDWACDQWKTYYLRNKTALGQTRAKEIINNDIANTNSFTTNVQWCKYDCDWVNFFAAEGLTTGNIFSKAYCATENVVTTVENVSQSAANITSSVKGITSSPIISIAMIGGAGYLAAKIFFPQLFKK